jgi:hypothetical protein
MILERQVTDLYTNNYNETALLALQANIDVQPVLESYAYIMYIVSYLTKDERDVCEFPKAARKEHADKEIRTQLRKLGSIFLNSLVEN